MIHYTTIDALNNLSHAINELYGYVNIPGDNFGEPSINSGPCAPFAKILYECWNTRFTNKVNLVFIMVRNSDECWHVLIRLPGGQLYDGGYGLHDESKYYQFDIEDMLNFDINLLEKRAYGLNRKYPTYCPDFSGSIVKSMIDEYLSKMDD